MATPLLKQDRLVSLDLFRGITMFLLLAEGAGVYEALQDLVAPGSWGAHLIHQFHHHPWNGLRFWDLIQPFFMFIVGVAMWFSVSKRLKKRSQRKVTTHIIRRCLILLALGVSLHIGYQQRLVWELWNVLSQLSITILLAYCLLKLPYKTQLAVSFGLLILTEILYRHTGIPGYDQPFVKDHNFGSYMDRVLMGKINPGGGWVAINCIPTAAHTIWGVLCGKLLDEKWSHREKLRYLVLGGILGLLLGYGLDIFGITPIIKRICTSSFVLASGGWCLLGLALFYWIWDVRGLRKGFPFFILVGMNSIFVYVFMETIGKQWFNPFFTIFFRDSIGQMGSSMQLVNLFSASLSLAFVWYLAWWLFKRKIFIKV